MKFFTVWLILSTPLFSDFTIKDRVAATLNSEIITQNDIYHECFVTKVESLISEETNHPKMLSPNKLRKICLENESKFLEFSLHNFLIINEIKKFGQLKLTKKERVKYTKNFLTKMVKKGIKINDFKKFKISFEKFKAIIVRRLNVEDHLKNSAQFKVFVSKDELKHFMQSNPQFFRGVPKEQALKKGYLYLETLKRNKKMILWLDDLKTRNSVKIMNYKNNNRKDADTKP